MANVGYGQQTPYDTNHPSNLVAFIIKQMIAGMDTMKLVKVTAVHSNGAVAAAGTVDVLPLINQVDGSGNGVPWATVHGIPWFRLQGGVNAVICDPVVGDIGYVNCADRDSSNVVRSKKQANPGSSRRYNIADGIYVGGCINDAPTQFLAFTDTGIKLADKNGNVIETTSEGITFTDAHGNTVSMTSNGIKLTGANGNVIDLTNGLAFTSAADTTFTTAGTFTSDKDITADGIDMTGHTHPVVGVQPGEGTLETGPATG